MELCRALLLHDFGIRWSLPPHRLCPALPSRLNYLLWLEDLLSPSLPPLPRITAPSCLSSPPAPSLPPLRGVVALDVGTGASCIYPLLGTALLGWRFIASETDPLSANAARENVRANAWSERIDVRLVPTPPLPVPAHREESCRTTPASETAHPKAETAQTTAEETAPYETAGVAPVLHGALRPGERVELVMCNPPFFDQSEAPHPRSDGVAPSLGAPHELFTPGGEVGFISRMISESLELHEAGGGSLWYSSLVGRKASLAPLLSALRLARARHVRSTELAQGSTSRWALAWSFSPLASTPLPVRSKVFHVELSPQQVQHRLLALLREEPRACLHPPSALSALPSLLASGSLRLGEEKEGEGGGVAHRRGSGGKGQNGRADDLRCVDPCFTACYPGGESWSGAREACMRGRERAMGGGGA